MENGLKPEQWSTVDIILLPKKVTLAVPGHYHGIGLSSLPAKITNKMILNRIQPVLDRIKMISAQNDLPPPTSSL